MFFQQTKSRASFTLVELLVVIGILAILTAAVVIVLNPAELLKQSRDSKRTTDLANLNNAIKLLLTQNPDVSLGVASTVYISLSDSSSTCGSYVLPSLPAGWQYHCATAADFQKTDGNGWIPVNFSGGTASLSSLPADPRNIAPYYYSYIASGSWEISGFLESKKYALRAQADAGIDPERFEVGSNLALWKDAYGLAGYWPFDDGSGVTARDKSGNGNDGNLLNGTAWQTGSGCIDGGCVSFDGVDDSIDFGDKPAFNFGTGSFSYAIWFYPSQNVGSYDMPWNKGGTSVNSPGYDMEFGSGSWNASLSDGSMTKPLVCGDSIVGRWTHVVVVADRKAQKLSCYINGVRTADLSLAGFGSVSSTSTAVMSYSSYRIKGLAGDMRLYSRVLSADEVQAIYNATK